MKTLLLRCILLLTAACFFGKNKLNAQVKIGANPSVINVNSLLELEGAKGFLLPRLTTAQMSQMSGVPTGMLIFNTSDSVMYMRRDTGWVMIVVSPLGVNPTLQQPVFADFYAMMPSDNVTVAAGAAVKFPQNG